MDRPKLLKHHVAHLRTSGLSDETIRLSACYSETDPERIARYLSWEHPAKSLGPCIVFPYMEVDNTFKPYKRLRPDYPRVAEDGRPVKYEAPVGQPNQAYFPPLARVAALTPKADLTITEGEKKALALDQHGVPCIGIPGVWAWSKKNDAGVIAMIADLLEIDWRGRKVVICFDSDCVENDNIQAAAFKLSETIKAIADRQQDAEERERRAGVNP